MAPSQRMPSRASVAVAPVRSICTLRRDRANNPVLPILRAVGRNPWYTVSRPKTSDGKQVPTGVVHLPLYESHLDFRITHVSVPLGVRRSISQATVAPMGSQGPSSADCGRASPPTACVSSSCMTGLALYKGTWGEQHAAFRSSRRRGVMASHTSDVRGPFPLIAGVRIFWSSAMIHHIKAFASHFLCPCAAMMPERGRQSDRPGETKRRAIL